MLKNRIEIEKKKHKLKNKKEKKNNIEMNRVMWRVKPLPPLVCFFFLLIMLILLMLVNCLGMETNIELILRCEKYFS